MEARKCEGLTYRYRWLCEVPLRDGDDAMIVNWLSIEITNPAGKVTYRNSFITDLPVDRNNVAELAACGRARWKIENETFNTLKTKGYNLEHNFGHGRDNLSAVLATLNLLAFAFHTVAELAEDRAMPRRFCDNVPKSQERVEEWKGRRHEVSGQGWNNFRSLSYQNGEPS